MADAEEPAQGLAKAMARVGGTGDTKEADAEIQEICAGVREEAQVAAQAAGWNGVFETFDPVCYTSQVVAGTNYFIKVRTSDAELVHIRVHKPLPTWVRHPSALVLSWAKLRTATWPTSRAGRTVPAVH